MSKHTPGPWTVTTLISHRATAYKILAGGVFVADVAKIDDAALLAEAPAMCAICEHVAAVYGGASIGADARAILDRLEHKL